MNSSAVASATAPSEDPDFDLAKKELPNRNTAYEALVRRHEKLLYRVCRRIMGNDSDAEDAFQEAMVKAFHGIKKFENRSSFKTWLCKIAHNTCYSSLKRIAKSQEYKNVFDELSGDQVHEGMVDEEFDSERILKSLSPEDRELLTLKYVGGLKFEEIADICDLGLSAVKMRIYRAAEQLRSKHNAYNVD